MQPQTPLLPPIQPLENYNFIINPETPKKQSPLLPHSNSMLSKVVIIGGGLVLLLIVFSVAKSLLVKGPNFTAFIPVVQDQQVILHLTSLAGQQQGLSATNTTFTATAQSVTTSAQTQLITYLKGQNQKITPAQISLKVGTTLDTQLSTAATAGTYDQTYATIMQNELKIYQQDLSRAYTSTKGVKGHALLNTDYSGATLLLQQISGN